MVRFADRNRAVFTVAYPDSVVAYYSPVKLPTSSACEPIICEQFGAEPRGDPIASQPLTDIRSPSQNRARKGQRICHCNCCARCDRPARQPVIPQAPQYRGRIPQFMVSPRGKLANDGVENAISDSLDISISFFCFNSCARWLRWLERRRRRWCCWYLELEMLDAYATV